jgi:hypothetical protein
MCEGVGVPEQRASGPAPHRAVELATYVSGAPAFMAALRARLVVHNGCLVTVDDDGRRYHLLVSPSTTSAGTAAP